MPMERGSYEEGGFRFPSDYKIYEIDENLRVLPKLKQHSQWKIIKKRDKVFDVTKQDTTNWLLAAAGKHNAGDLSDLLQLADHVLGLFTIEILSDRNMELQIYMPSSDRRGGIHEDPDAVATAQNTPWNRPRLWFPSWGKTWSPKFKWYNPTEYTPEMVYLRFRGYQYELVDLEGQPARFDTVNLGMITGGGK